MNWITVQAAIKITGHSTTDALRKWRARMVSRYPGLRIRTRPGYINQVDLQEALRAAEHPAPNTIAARAAAIMTNTRSRTT